MDSTAHSSNAFIYYILIFTLFWNSQPPIIYTLFVIVFGILPDLDGLFFLIKGKNPKDNTFQHHLYFGTHWPITYTPLLILLIISFIFDFYSQIVLIPVVGIYVHLLSDSACCGDGMMWTKTYNKEKFAPFYNFFSKKTDGYHGNYWAVRWRKTIMYKIAHIEALFIVIYLIWRQINAGSFSMAALLIILFLIFSIYVNSQEIDEKYTKEPPNGRYDDYRRNSDYLNWMENNNYEFDDKMHVVKKKDVQK